MGDSSDLPEANGMVVVGEIAQIPRRSTAANRQGSRQSEMELRVYQESLDNLQTTLTLSDPIGAMRIIAITSAVSDEGKTSVASQLAMSLSRAIRDRVLVIDGDMRSPGDPSRLRHPSRSGPGGGSCRQVQACRRHRHHLERSRPLSPRRQAGRPAAQLAGRRGMAGFAGADSRRLPVRDRRHPAGAGRREALILAKSADAVLICTLRDHSRTEQVLMVHEKLKSVGGHPVGVVLNGVPTKNYLRRYGNQDYAGPE